MPINPRSTIRIDEFLTELSKNGVHSVRQSRSIYLTNNVKTSIRTTTKSDPKIWYDVSKGVIDSVDYFLYQAESKHNFLLFPSQFFSHQYDSLKDSNRVGAKLFYIDNKNKQFISKKESPQDISQYYCSLLPGEISGGWKKIFLNRGQSAAEPSIAYYPANDKLLSVQVETDLDSLELEERRIEGEITEFLSIRFERDAKLRTAAIAHHGTTCKVCEFNFKAVYGKHGENYIEVHHKTPISKLTEPTMVNPIIDLTVLCSNCHRMIHRKADAPLSIEALREILKSTSISPYSSR